MNKPVGEDVYTPVFWFAENAKGTNRTGPFETKHDAVKWLASSSVQHEHWVPVQLYRRVAYVQKV